MSSGLKERDVSSFLLHKRLIYTKPDRHFFKNELLCMDIARICPFDLPSGQIIDNKHHYWLIQLYSDMLIIISQVTLTFSWPDTQVRLYRCCFSL